MAITATDTDSAIDRLYGLPLDDFTAARDQLAKERKAAGDKEGAATIKSLRKPTVAAWALNQLSRKNAKVLGDFLELGERLRKAQRAAMSGRGAAGLRDLAATRRKSVDDLTKKTMKHLGPSGEAQREAIAASLEAALASEDAADQLQDGRLVKPLEAPSGFGEEIPGLSAVPDPPDTTTGTATDSAREARERRRAARAQRRGTAPGDRDGDADADANDDGGAAARQRKQELERIAGEKAAALEKAKEEAQAAAREAAAARAEVSRLQDALVTANGRAKAAAERARVAQWTQSQAQQELDAATRRSLDE